MECYFDNSATTRCSEKAAEKMRQVLLTDYGNPSSLHTKGMAAENYIKESRETIAKTLKCDPKEIIFTSGGSEGNNLAIFGSVRANKRIGKHIITTAVEHAAVYMPFKELEKQGYDVTFLPTDEKGVIRLDDLENALTDDTVLVAMMQVNNEIGSVMPVAEAGKLIREKCPEAVFFVDAIQSYGKVPVIPKKMGIDLMSVSGHKIHGPKGSGFLYKRDKVKLDPIIFGGGQEGGFRSGTENVPAIAGLGVAVQEMFADFDGHRKHLFELKDHLAEKLSDIEAVSFNSQLDENSAPQILSVSIEGVRAEVLLHALEDKDIYVSAGSACSSNRPAVSRTLKSIGLKDSLLESTVRFSFSIYNTLEQVDYASDVMHELIPVLLKYRRF